MARPRHQGLQRTRDINKVGRAANQTARTRSQRLGRGGHDRRVKGPAKGGVVGFVAAQQRAGRKKAADKQAAAIESMKAAELAKQTAFLEQLTQRAAGASQGTLAQQRSDGMYSQAQRRQRMTVRQASRNRRR